MAKSHPYVPSGGPLVQVISHLRNSFPATLDAKTLMKLGFAPKNEGYVLNVLRFVGVIDAQGKKTESAAKVFSQHDDAAFQSGFSPLVETAYEELFEAWGKDTWNLPTEKLITYFRQTDQTSALVGQRQANTFSTLSALAGHKSLVAPKTSAPSSNSNKEKTKPAKAKAEPKATPQKPTEKIEITPPNGASDFGLTVRIEINLPADGQQETYDRIFKSIRENLLNGR